MIGSGRYSDFYTSGWLYAFHHDGTPFAADTVLVEIDRGIGPFQVAIANLQGDRRPEIMVSCDRPHLHAFSVDGQPIEGWPPPSIGAVENMPVAIDAIDGVAQAIVVNAYSGNVAIYDPYGEFYSPWPLGYGRVGFQCQPLVADLDGDIDLEIFAGGSRPYIWALEQDGSNVEGWPYYSDDQNFGSGTLADLDEDGDTDIVFQGYDQLIHVFDTAGIWDYKRIECGTWLYDNWHTGSYHKDLYREAESANSMIGFETVADTSAWGHGAIRFAAEGARTKAITSTTEIKVPATLYYRTEVPVWEEYSLWVRIRRDDASKARPDLAIMIDGDKRVGGGHRVAGSPGPWVWFEMGRLPLRAGVHDLRVRAPKLPIVIDRWMLTTRTRFPLLAEQPHAWE
ncbi:MAG: hypothetical protein CME06_02115 [Gemmatimonadetes bacterium]|nr:hypothetical protein [Gemmatimonadota bacterium]